MTARRLLLPDASVTWNVTAVPAAVRIVRREGIDVVLTTSPPGSVHFVGAAVQRLTDARWIADLRDPVVANPHRRDDTAAARARQAVNEQVARLVARQADAISCVSAAIADEMRGLDPRGLVRVIGNGCDFDDFAGLEYTPRRRASASRTRAASSGSETRGRSCRRFHDADLDAVVRFVGDFRSADREWADSLALGDRLGSSTTSRAPSRCGCSATPRRSCSSSRMQEEGKGVLSGKVYEYLAAGRPSSRSCRLTGRPPRSCARRARASSQRRTTSGGSATHSSSFIARYANGGLPAVELDPDDEERLSRRARVEEMAELVRRVAGR